MNKTFKWTEQQEDIFNWFETGTGNAIVTARAGTGKSTTIIEGLNRAKTDSACYTVFNKRNQVLAEPLIKNKLIQVKTLHSLGYSFIAQNWRGVRGDAWTEYNRIKNLADDAPKQIIFLTAKLVSFIKNTCIEPTLDDAINIANQRGIDSDNPKWTNQNIAELALQSINLSKEYPRDKKISFDDMVFLPCALNLVRKTYSLLCVDECQDLSLPQLTMAIGACKDDGRICMVGDNRQQCYGFRGALPNGMDIFKQKIKAKEFKLTITYRCPKKIVEFAKLTVPDIEAHESAIEGKIETLNEEKAFNLIKVNDVCLSRTNAPLVPAALNLIRKGIPSFILGKDIGKNLLKIIEDLNVTNFNNFENQLNVWEQTKVARASGWGATAYVELVQDQSATLKVLAESCNSIKELENKINSLFLDEDGVRVPSVTFSTSHKFKGMEAHNIFLLNKTYNVGRRKLTPAEADEESNIWYISVTRSKENLYLVSPDKKQVKPDKDKSV